MATPTKTIAVAANPDTNPAARIVLYRSDASASPPSVLHVAISVSRVDGSTDTTDLLLENADGTPATEGGLTTGQLATVKSVVTGLYNRGLTKAGYV